RHPAGRTAVFLGDLVDRGPDTPGVLRTVMGMVASGAALCVPGNHEAKLLRALRGRDARMSHGLAESLAQLGAEPEEFRAQVIAFLDGLVSHYVLDSGRLVVAHVGLREEMHGRASAAVRAFALYGETTGETDEFGLPVRYHRAPRPGDHPGAERRRRAGGDEQVRGRSAVADLPAADDAARARQRQARPAGASGGRAGRLPAGRGDPGGLRGEAHGLAGGRDR